MMDVSPGEATAPPVDLPEDPTVAESDIQADQHLSSATQAVPTQNQSGVSNAAVNAAANVPPISTPAAQAANVPLPASPAAEAPAPAPAPSYNGPSPSFFNSFQDGYLIDHVNLSDLQVGSLTLGNLPPGTTTNDSGQFILPDGGGIPGRVLQDNGVFATNDKGEYITNTPGIYLSIDGLQYDDQGNQINNPPANPSNNVGNGKPVAGGKRKRGGASPWTDFVKQHYHELKKKDPDITLAKAAKHASEAWKAKKAKKS